MNTIEQNNCKLKKSINQSRKSDSNLKSICPIRGCFINMLPEWQYRPWTLSSSNLDKLIDGGFGVVVCGRK
ncbi:MAG: hypothetical protein KZQ70_15045, partial [gamma proteobacterium symbiont of Lucinoma myriamae]|nr:hypothetical protein [gamma proteobacterium symbiont of Lucinoma myriamae]